ncbi:Hypothetical predicted protein [Cloeon dipterum]|uniref:Sortilin-related receptor n=3 Tax=Cloeon dipterum TaxID=197152 RepID=A0A8S1CFD8_9INSE|nr:Hypothetical predicted protein [Cloeon dipterum]
MMRRLAFSALLLLAWVADDALVGGRLTLSPDLRRPASGPKAVFAADPAEEGPEDGQAPTRVRREATLDPNIKPKVEVVHLNDTRQQLMVHWAGDNSNLVVCLAKDVTLVFGQTKSLRPSTVYISYDYGSTFKNRTEFFRLNNSQNAGYAHLDNFYNHNKFYSHFVFPDKENRVIFTTNDYGRTVKRQRVDFTISELSFHDEEPETIVALDASTEDKKLWLTDNFGRTWTMVQEYVFAYKWMSVPGRPTTLYVQRQEPTGTFSVLTSPSLFRTRGDIQVVVTGVSQFEIVDNFMFASRKVENKDAYEMLVSRDREAFMTAVFPNDLPTLAFHVCDVSNGQVMVSVSHGRSLSNLYVSDSTRDQQMLFSLSMASVLAYFPNITWADSILKDLTNEPFADIYKVKGMRGIYIASQVKESTVSRIGPESLVTMITFDQGGQWRRITPPVTDANGNKFNNCNSSADCSLHLSQRFGQLYPSIRSIPILSSASAPGLIMATGAVGRSLKSHASVFMSHDAGLTWRDELPGLYIYAMGDHGGLLVAVKYFRDNTKAKELVYSIDEGANWQSIEFHDQELKIYNLLTEPGENTTTFTMFGSLPNKHQWIIVKIDLRNVFKYDCTPDDYKFWSPSSDDGPHMPCILGRKETYQRRLPHSQCYNGKNFDGPIKMETCECDYEDFDCDFGFTRSVEIKTCVRNKTSGVDPFAVPTFCKPGATFNRTKGYLKIPGDVCQGGNEHRFLPARIPCPIKEQDDFLVVSQRERIGTISLSGNRQFQHIPIKGIKAVIGVEYDMQNNCFFYGDADQDFIGRQCVGNGTSEPEVLVKTNLESVEGMSYDWINHLLYFVDGARSSIELIRTDINHSGRMRLTVLEKSQLKKPRGIAVHPIEGYVFFTDWAPGEPSISRCNADGSKVRHLFTNNVVHWPNGITIDYTYERIYWVDAKLDYIGSSDLEGKKFRKVLTNSKFIEHPFAIAVFKDNMYWTDWKKNAIFEADKDHGVGVTTLAAGLSNVMDLKAYSAGMQAHVVNHACALANCSHVCVAMPGHTFKCLCPDGLELSGSQCYCPMKLKPLQNGTCPAVKYKCPVDYFRCRNGNCVPKLWRCDGDNDCSDNSDEDNCGLSTCQVNHFQCKKSGKCIPSFWKCDFDLDCEDGSDEEGCSYSNCTKDQFKCDNGRCINLKWVCDMEDDCRDGSDEKVCPSFKPVTCEDGEFRCGGNTTQCIPTTWRCDGDNDCHDQSDEQNCQQNKCEPWQFTCGTDQCIFKSWVCDGEDDCPDRSDEKNCTAPATRAPTTLPPRIQAPCNEWQFTCNNKKCIPSWWKCDSVNDCGDNSDEQDCWADASTTRKPPKPSPTPPSGTCLLNQFRCYDGTCILETWVCDGVADCTHDEDEEHCGQAGCLSDQYACRVDGACVNITMVCNGKKDCIDGSDEFGCDGKPPNLPDDTVCSSGFFSCDAGSICLPLSKMCDGHPDCYDESDESVCSRNSSKVYQVLQMSVNERSISSDTIMLYWWIPKPANLTFEFLPSRSEVSSSAPMAEWVNNSAWVDSNNFQAAVSGLKPFQLYNLTVFVRLKGSDVVYPPAKYITARTAEGVPSPPYGIKATFKSSNELEVSWNEPLKANGIIVSYTLFMSPPYPPIEQQLYPKPNHHVIKMDFLPDEPYSIWMTVKNGRETSNTSEITSAKISGSVVAPIEGLNVTKVSNDSVTLMWRGVQNADGYRVSAKGRLAYAVLDTRTVTQPTIEFSMLAPGATYTFKVTAYHLGYSGISSQVTATTEGVELPVVPNVKAEVVKSQGTTVKVTWDQPKDSRNAKWYYGVYYGTDMSHLMQRPLVTTSELSVSILQLAACESYLFDVGIVGPLGAGPISGRQVNLITEYSPTAEPKNLRAARHPVTPTKLTVSWSASCDAIQMPISYFVFFDEVTTKKHYVKQTAESNASTFSLEFDGVYGAEYSIQVSTSAFGALKSASVLHSIPIPAPHQLQVLPESNGSLIIYWQNKELPTELAKDKYQYEVLISKGSWQGVEKARKFYAAEAPFVLNETDSGTAYSVAVRLVTSKGYYSLLSEINTMETSQMSWSELITPTHVVSVAVPVVLVIVALAATLGCYVYRHHRLQHSFSSFANSHYNTRSGAATFTGGEGLDEDDAPVITGFSDDEPLVIA